MRQSFMLRREERNSTTKSAMLPEDYTTFQSTIQQCTSSPITHFSYLESYAVGHMPMPQQN